MSQEVTLKQIIRTSSAPEPVGPYSQAVRVGNLLFTAGQIAIDPATGKLVGGGIKPQTEQVLKNIQAILEAAGTSMEFVVKATVFLKNMDDFGEMNTVYGGFFSQDPPARSAVEVAHLPKDVLVEIECIAYIP